MQDRERRLAPRRNRLGAAVPAGALELLGGVGALIAVLSILLLPAPAGAQTLAISPSSATVPVGTTRQLVASLNGTTTTAVTWAVNGTPGGDLTVGKIDANGVYAAPESPPAGWNVTVTAKLVANSAVTASSVLTLRNRIPWPTSLNPTQLTVGSFTLQVIGSRFVNGAQVLLNGVPLTTKFDSTTQLTASGVASKVGAAQITVANPGPTAVSEALAINVISGVSVALNPLTAKLAVGDSQQFVATVSGSSNTAVTWAVNGKTGGDGSIGSITPQGVYTAPLAVPLAGLVAVSATSTAPGASQAKATVSIFDPLAITRGRLLDQATFGPTPALMTEVAQKGIAGFVDAQLALPESPWPSVATATRANVIDAFFANAFTGTDQLRQRVIFALSEFIVEAFNKNTNGNEMVTWLQILSRNALGNYRDLLEEITLDASMGKYLDLANSGASGAANENYPREMMQLFSIGLFELNPDGSTKLDAGGNTTPTYTQVDVQNVAKALTGWTYGNASGIPPAQPRYSFYPGLMLPVAAIHNNAPKAILGHTLPANRGILADFDDVIDIAFNHPNVGPFVATRLIRALVTSNPTPQYIARIAAVFDDDGTGERGDMKAVVRAILLDPEARNDTPPSSFGRLRTPMQDIIAVARALGLNLGAASQFAYLFYGMNEGLLDANSVFGHYSPSYRISKTALFGPEFQIYSSSDAINRANFFYSMFFNPWPINPVLQPFVGAAADPSTLVQAVDQALLYGRMSQSTRGAITTAVIAMPDNNARALAALYLTVTSGEHLVQR